MKELTRGVAHACMNKTEILNQSKHASNEYSLEEVHSACVELCRRFGFDHFFYISKTPEEPIPRIILVQGETNNAKPTLYRKGYHRFGSEAVHTARFCDLLGGISNELKSDIEAIISDGTLRVPLRSSLSFPVKDAQGKESLLVLASTVSDRLAQFESTQLSHAQDFVRKIHNVANSLIASDKNSVVAKLTKRELECLQWAADGKTNWEIGEILGVTKRTVVFHLKNSSGKLNTANRYHTVAQAINVGLIKPRQT